MADMNKVWEEVWKVQISEIMSKELEDMTYDDLAKLTLAFKDNEEMNNWWKKGAGYYTKMQSIYKEKYGVGFPIMDDAPAKVQQAYTRLCEMERKAAKEGTILY